MRILPGWVRPALTDISSFASPGLLRMCVPGAATTGTTESIAWPAQSPRLRRSLRTATVALSRASSCCRLSTRVLDTLIPVRRFASRSLSHEATSCCRAIASSLSLHHDIDALDQRRQGGSSEGALFATARAGRKEELLLRMFDPFQRPPASKTHIFSIMAPR